MKSRTNLPVKICHLKVDGAVIHVQEYKMLVIREVVSPTVENRAAMGVFLPTVLKRFALQYLLMSCVTSKYPKAPAQTHSGSHSYYCNYKGLLHGVCL